jgi:ferredoxin--NADP+ reductase
LEQMLEVLEAKDLAPDVRYLKIRSPKVAKRRKAGQFVIVRADPNGERIPLTIADADPEKGWIALICQGIGKTTRQLNTAVAGDRIPDLAGPLGMPSRIEHFGNVVVIGGGVGTAIAYPTAVALHEAGNRVAAIIGGRSRPYVILEDEMRKVADEVYPTTDDGSYGYHGFVTGKLEELISSGPSIDHLLAIGPIPMMRAVAELTRPHEIETIVSLNPIMVDGTGMCGGCRVEVGGEMKFACVDGPEFDAHQVNFELLARRNRTYVEYERRSLEQWEAAHPHAAGVQR